MFWHTVRKPLAGLFLGLVAVASALPASAATYLQCVPFARDASGIDIRGNAETWWDQAAGRFDRGQTPRVGAVMAMPGTAAMPLGHVAVVREVVSDREICIDHSNWSPINGRRGQIERDVKVVDVSPKGDWSLVRVWYAPIRALGLRPNPVSGFSYGGKDRSGATPMVLAAATARFGADWRPGNGLDAIVRTLASN